MSTVIAISWDHDTDTYGERYAACNGCGYRAYGESAVDEHEQVAHHECAGCGETYSDAHHEEPDARPTVIFGEHYCHADCFHNRLWDSGYAIVVGRLVTNVECLRRSRLKIVAAEAAA